MKGVLALCLCAGSALAEPRFEDMSDHLPPHVYDGGWEHFSGGGVAVFDCDADQLPDIFAAGGTNPAVLIRNRGAFQFAPASLPEIIGAIGAYPIDMDADGLMDLFVLREGPNVVLKGGPRCTFTDATAQFGIPQEDRWSTAFTAWWEQDAKRPTLVVGNYVDRFNSDGPFEACDDNTLLRPQQKGYAATDLSPGFCPLSILAAYDARGRLALRFANDRHYYVAGGYEQMWDIGDKRFLGEEDGWSRQSLWGKGIASRDLNGDGRDEVLITSLGNQLLHFAAPDGSYTLAPYAMGTTAERPYHGGDGRPSSGWHAEFADVDNDARVDLFIAKGNADQTPGMATKDPNNLLMQKPDGTFVEGGRIAEVGSLDRARGAALADFDQDGRLDLVVVNRRAPLALYRNITEHTGNWLGITLAQEGGNRNAIGTRIEVRSVGTSQTMQKMIGGGHAGGQSLSLHFGLGDATEAQVTVTWPDQTVSHEVLSANSVQTITKAP